MVPPAPTNWLVPEQARVGESQLMAHDVAPKSAQQLGGSLVGLQTAVLIAQVPFDADPDPKCLRSTYPLALTASVFERTAPGFLSQATSFAA